MRYVVVCLLKGKVLAFHEKIVSEVCSRFNVKRQKLPAHFTIKAPFETEDLGPVEELTSIFVKEQEASGLQIDGYGSFRKNVVFMKINPSEKMKEVCNSYIKELRCVKNLEWKPNEKIEKVYHCTVVSKLPEGKFNEILSFAKENPCFFETTFDNISILIWRNNHWETHKEFKLNTPNLS